MKCRRNEKNDKNFHTVKDGKTKSKIFAKIVTVSVHTLNVLWTIVETERKVLQARGKISIIQHANVSAIYNTEKRSRSI